MKRNLLTTLKTSAVLIGGALMAQSAWASGYHFGTQSVNAQATANASTAEAADPSTVFHNPAGLTHLEGTQATINLNLVAPSVKYDDAKAEYPASVLTGGQKQAVAGETSGSIDPGLSVVPHLYASHRLNERVALGLGLYVPFGSGTEYDKDSVLRYNLNKLGLETMALQPTVAFKLNDQHSFAIGLVAQRTKADLRQFANFGAAIQGTAARQAQQAQQAAQQAAAAAQQAAAAGDLTAAQNYQAQAQQYAAAAQQAATVMNRFGNGTADGYAEVEGGDWGFGYNLAWLWDINDRARVGVNYRSKINHTLSGDAEWQLYDPVFRDATYGTLATNGIRGAGYAAKEDANVKIVTPESLSLHGMYKINPQWNVFGDLTWTRHSRFNRVELNFANDKVVADPVNGGTTMSNQTILNPNWRNTWRLALGASYQVSEPLQLRFGWAYDQSPVKSSNYRMSTLPDANRMWFSFGTKYDFNKNHTVNLAYTYVHINKARANVNGWCGAAESGVNAQACVSSRTNGSASFKSHSHILGAQYTYRF